MLMNASSMVQTVTKMPSLIVPSFVLLKSRGLTFEFVFAISVNLVVFNNSLVHEVLQIGDPTMIIFINLISYPLHPCLGLFNLILV